MTEKVAKPLIVKRITLKLCMFFVLTRSETTADWCDNIQMKAWQPPFLRIARSNKGRSPRAGQFTAWRSSSFPRILNLYQQHRRTATQAGKIKLLFSQSYWLENSACSKDTHWCLLGETNLLQSLRRRKFKKRDFEKKKPELPFAHCVSNRLRRTLQPGLRYWLLLLLILHVRLKLRSTMFLCRVFWRITEPQAPTGRLFTHDKDNVLC